MSLIVEKPKVLQLTDDWYDIQYTNLHYYHTMKSEEFNKLLKAFGRGSFFIIRGFKLAIFKDTVDGVDSCIARLTPGALVQDFTIIDFVQQLKESKKYIYVKLFDIHDDLLPGKIFKLGSRYFHGTIGDGIRRTATYSTIESISINARNQNNFRTFYRITLGPNYTRNTIDLNNIVVDDFRFPPINKETTDEIDPWEPSADNVIKVNPDDVDNTNNSSSSSSTITNSTNNITDISYKDSISEDDVDYVNLLSRSNSMTWSLVFGN